MLRIRNITAALCVALLGLLEASAAVNVKKVWTVGPAKADPGFTAWASATLAELKARKDLPVRGLVNLTNTLVQATFVFPEDVTASSSGGKAVWLWIIADADGSDSVSLADISGVLTSSDAGNSLGKTFTFAGTTYSALAIGMNNDQPDITSGPAGQTAKTVIAAVGFKSYLASEDDVKNFIYSFSEPEAWSLSAMVSVKGVTTTSSLRRGLPYPQISGGMTTTSTNTVWTPVQVLVRNNGNPYSYQLVSVPQAGATNWQVITNLRAGQSHILASANDTNQPTAVLALRVLPTSALGPVQMAQKKVAPPPVVDNDLV